MIDIEATTKDLKTVADFLVKGAEGKVPNLTDDEAKEFDSKAVKVIVDSSNDLICAKFSPIMNMNILEMNIHFFDNLPKVFGCIQNAAEISLKYSGV